MKKKEKKEVGKLLINSLYSVKLLFSLSKSRTLHTVFRQISNYVISIFYSSFFMRFLVDALQHKRSPRYMIMYITIVGIASLLLSIYIYYCDNVLFPIGDIKIYKGIYKNIYSKSENVELQCYEDKDFYNSYTIALDDAGTKITDIVVHSTRIVFGTIAGLVSFCIMMQIDKLTILFLAGPLLGNFLIAPRLSKLTYQRYLDGVKYQRRAEYVNRVMYLVDYAKEIRMSNIFHVLTREYTKSMDGLSSLYKKYFKAEIPKGILQYILSYVVIFEGILLYGAYRAIVPTSNKISFSNLVVLTSTMVFASWNWLAVRDSLNSCIGNSLFISKYKMYMNYEEKIPENLDGLIPDKKIESIEFRDVSFSYLGGKDILKHVSFIIKGDTTTAFVGHNGAGKTTIIKLLMRLYDPTEGSIYLNNRNIKEYNLKAYRELFTTAFQDFKLYGGTVRYNLMMGEQIDNEEERIAETLKSTGIYDCIMNLPNGLDTILTKEFDDKGVILSGGEYQKLIVARAYLRDASIGIFDEPSSALDPISEFELFKSIENYSKGRVGIYISHRLSCVKNADMVFILENGEVIEQGTHQELMELGKEYAKIYKLQEKNYMDSVERIL